MDTPKNSNQTDFNLNPSLKKWTAEQSPIEVIFRQGSQPQSPLATQSLRGSLTDAAFFGVTIKDTENRSVFVPWQEIHALRDDRR